MKARTIAMLCVLGGLALFAQDVQMGTWRLIEAKSRFSAGATRYSVVVFRAAGDEGTVTVGGTDAHGKPTRNEWRGEGKGKNHAAGGNASDETRSLTIAEDTPPG